MMKNDIKKNYSHKIKRSKKKKRIRVYVCTFWFMLVSQLAVLCKLFLETS